MRGVVSLAVFVLTMPVALLVAFAVLIGDSVASAIARLHNLVARPSHQNGQRDTSHASIIILNWNGRELLAQGLPSVLTAVERAGGEHEVIVVDNGSSDGSADFVRQAFPTVRVLALERNMGFGQGNNIGVQAANNDIVVLLNNDMVVDPGFLSPLLRPFIDDRVFAVSAQIIMTDHQESHVESGLTRGDIRDGRLHLWHDSVSSNRQLLSCLWAGGGSAAFDRRRFLALGGFNSLYRPFYVEDVDLSYRAWKRGWFVFFAPESIVYHRHRVSTSRLGNEYVERAMRKNMLLFVWHNITDPQWTLESLLCLPADLCSKWANNDKYKAILWAVQQMPEALWRRWREKATGGQVLTDRDIFQITNSHYYYKERFVPPLPMSDNKRKKILILCPYLPVPPTHGGAVRMFNLIKNLSLNNDVDVLSFFDTDAEREAAPQLTPYCRRLRLVQRRPPYRCYRPLHDRSWYIEEFDTPDMRQAVLDMLGEEDYHVLQIEYAQMAQYHPGGCRCLTVLDEVDVYFRSFYRQNIAGRRWPQAQEVVDYLKIARYEIESCRRFDWVLTMSAVDAAYLAQYLPDRRERIIEVANGVDTDYYTPADRWPGGHDLLFIGSYRHTPNREGMRYFLREIFPLIQQKAPQVHVYIVGDGPWADIDEIAEQPAVTVTGFVEDIRLYLAHCAVSIVPILSGAGTRIKILESLAAGIPVVSTTIGCEGIEVQPEQDVLIADTPADFAAAILKVLDDAALAERLRYSGRRLVEERYDWRAIATRLNRLYNSR